LNMQAHQIICKIKTATEQEIFLHLAECSDAFIPPLAGRVDIGEYAGKIHEKSVTFEAWDDRLLVGLIAAYFNDTANGSAFITSVSMTGRLAGLGIASKLLDMCIEYARQHNIQELALEVHKDNNPAICFYNKFGFKDHEIKDDMRVMKRRI